MTKREPSRQELERRVREAALTLNIELRAAALAGVETCVDLAEAPAPTHCAQVTIQFPVPSE